MTAARFYEERDRRTVEYLIGNSSPLMLPVSVHAGDDACLTKAGQMVLVTLANQMARVHRNLHFALRSPEARLLTNPLCRGRTLGEEIEQLCGRIDPFGSFTVGGPSLQSRSSVAVGVGLDVSANLNWYLGNERFIARLQRSRCPVGEDSTGDLFGAGLAAVLGASAAFKNGMGVETVPTVLSAWNLNTGDDAAPGPSNVPILNVGRGLMVGAGAVGSAVMYWLAHLGDVSDWTVVDADVVKLHNTNRCLLFFPDDAGWPDRIPRSKVSCIGTVRDDVTPVRQWYHEADACADIFDVNLILANDHHVRTLVSSRNDPIQLQGTTGQSWLSQLHRHIVGRDDCVRCRMDDIKDPALICGEVPLDVSDGPSETDAALPFLTAAAGLMVVSALLRLHVGEFGRRRVNTWRWDFRTTQAMTSFGTHRCHDGCSTKLPSSVRREIAQNTRWVGSRWLNSLGSAKPG